MKTLVGDEMRVAGAVAKSTPRWPNVLCFAVTALLTVSCNLSDRSRGNVKSRSQDRSRFAPFDAFRANPETLIPGSLAAAEHYLALLGSAVEAASSQSASSEQGTLAKRVFSSVFDPARLFKPPIESDADHVAMRLNISECPGSDSALAAMEANGDQVFCHHAAIAERLEQEVASQLEGGPSSGGLLRVEGASRHISLAPPLAEGSAGTSEIIWDRAPDPSCMQRTVALSQALRQEFVDSGEWHPTLLTRSLFFLMDAVSGCRFGLLRYRAGDDPQLEGLLQLTQSAPGLPLLFETRRHNRDAFTAKASVLEELWALDTLLQMFPMIQIEPLFLNDGTHLKKTTIASRFGLPRFPIQFAPDYAFEDADDGEVYDGLRMALHDASHALTQAAKLVPHFYDLERVLQTSEQDLEGLSCRVDTEDGFDDDYQVDRNESLKCKGLSYYDSHGSSPSTANGYPCTRPADHALRVDQGLAWYKPIYDRQRWVLSWLDALSNEPVQLPEPWDSLDRVFSSAHEFGYPIVLEPHVDAIRIAWQQWHRIKAPEKAPRPYGGYENDPTIVTIIFPEKPWGGAPPAIDLAFDLDRTVSN